MTTQKRKTARTSMPTSMYKDLKRAAKDGDMTISKYIQQAVKEKLERK